MTKLLILKLKASEATSYKLVYYTNPAHLRNCQNGAFYALIAHILTGGKKICIDHVILSERSESKDLSPDSSTSVGMTYKN